jgi:translation initiation factor 3 subunit F
LQLVLKMTPSALLLPTECVESVNIHPVVIFQILDRYLRRIEGQDRVIGTLLGSVTNGIAEVTTCFPVPHSENDDEVAVGKDFHRQMVRLHQQVNPNEQVIGWYASAPNAVVINEQSCLIHDFYRTECADPLHLIVDTSLANATLQVKTFVSSTYGVARSAFAHQFKQIPTTPLLRAAERIAIDHMVRQSCPGEEENTELEGLEQSIFKLHSLLQKASDFVREVREGKRPPDVQRGRDIQRALSCIPPLRPEVFNRVFNSELQDLLMVSYLSSLTQAQLVMAENLTHRLTE